MSHAVQNISCILATGLLPQRPGMLESCALATVQLEFIQGEMEPSGLCNQESLKKCPLLLYSMHRLQAVDRGMDFCSCTHPAKASSISLENRAATGIKQFYCGG